MNVAKKQIDFQTVWNTLSPRLTSSGEVSQTIQIDPEKASLLSSHADSLDSIPAISFFSKELSQQEESFSEIEVIGILGEGGEGKVELAYQRSLKREVALKTSKRNEKKHQLHLLRESQIMGQLEHPNVIPVHWVGKDQEGSPRILMKKVEGISWQELLQNPVHPHWKLLFQKSKSQDPLEIQLEIFQQVLNALEYAHSKGIVHRDIKPENIMLGNLGEVYLLDWGIAVFVEETKDPNHPMANQTVGTPCFMAPEMILGDLKEVSPATDIYLLGGTLHFVLTGQPPHRGHSMEEVLFQAFLSEPQEYPSNVSPELADICNQAMQIDPAERFQNIQELREALFLFLRNKEVQELLDKAKTLAQQILHHKKEWEKANHESKELHYKELQNSLIAFRFVFQQVQEKTPNHPESLLLWENTIKIVLEVEIQELNLGMAESLLEELSHHQREPWKQRIAIAKEEEKKKAQSLKEFHHLQEGANIQFAGKSRSLISLFIGIVTSAFFLLAANKSILPWNQPYSWKDYFSFLLVPCLLFFIFVFLMRKKLFGNAINTKLMFSMFSVFVFLGIVRFVSIRLNMAVYQISIFELLLVAISVLLISINLGLRWFLWIVCIYLVFASLIFTFPEKVFALYMGGNLFSWLLLSRIFYLQESKTNLVQHKDRK